MPSLNSSQRILLIGLDGATFNVLDPLLRAGQLPNLARLADQGVRRTLLSTIQAESATAWTTICTGRNAAKHGIYSFVSRHPVDHSFQVVNSTRIHGERLWDIVGRHGQRVAVLNVPITYPASRVNGLIVTGMLTPGWQGASTYPQELREELGSVFANYRFSVERRRYLPDAQGDAQFVKDLEAATEQRLRLALHMMTQEPWDFFMVVFTELDRLQHFLWAQMDPAHPLHQPESAPLKHAIPHHYRLLDQAIGKLIEAAGSDVVTMVISDHGFTGWYKFLYLNDWLIEQGFFSMRHRRGPGLRRRLKRYLARFDTLRNLKKSIEGVSPELVNLVTGPRETAHDDAPPWHHVDWSKTQAFVDVDRGIRINLRGREPQGIVQPGSEYEALCETLIQSLNTLVDRETGRPIIHRVYRREDLYHGPYLKSAPDLIVEPVRNSPDYRQNYAEHGLNPTPDGGIIALSDQLTGNHIREGIFFMTGEGVRTGKTLDEADILDVAPTALYVLGLPIPQEMDGQVMTSAFQPNYLATRAVKRETADQIQRSSSEADVYSEEEQAQLTERLRDLGYL